MIEQTPHSKPLSSQETDEFALSCSLCEELHYSGCKRFPQNMSLCAEKCDEEPYIRAEKCNFATFIRAKKCCDEKNRPLYAVGCWL